MPTPDPAAATVPYELSPFPGEPAPEGLGIRGSAGRDGECLTLRYALSGPLQQLRIPERDATPGRLDGLWQTTCLECFLALPEDPGYWELNVSPTGDWNLYQLDAYREGLRPEPACPEAPRLQRRDHSGVLEFEVCLVLPPPLAMAPALELAVTAVVATRDAAISYWALRHPCPQADFHHRGGFALRL
jgi:hypothetical protein